MPRTPRQAGAKPADTARFVAYYRVSTERQGESRLGLDAQQAAVIKYVDGFPGATLAAEFTEVESGKNAARLQLALALAEARAIGAVLVVAKLDRLARNAAFLLRTVEGAGDGGVVFCDLPQVPAGPVGKFFVTLLAAVAEMEAGLISQRTKAALAQAKARGVKLGNPRLRPGDAEGAAHARAARTEHARANCARLAIFIAAARAAGCATLADVAEAMMARGIKAPSGNATWHPATVHTIERLAA